jgi:hypothetical protein
MIEQLCGVPSTLIHSVVLIELVTAIAGCAQVCRRWFMAGTVQGKRTSVSCVARELRPWYAIN